MARNSLPMNFSEHFQESGDYLESEGEEEGQCCQSIYSATTYAAY
jgi:hypothetical protein